MMTQAKKRRRGPSKIYKLEFFHRPGDTLDDVELAALVARMRAIAAECFEEIPEYQALTGAREHLSNQIITVARRPDGTIGAFCSALLLEVRGVSPVLHLGLTCVHPEDRAQSLTHKLLSHMLTRFLVRFHPFGKVWISNCACVLSSIGNVALSFDDVYPSPYNPEPPSRAHLKIARAISERYRDEIYINDDALFDERAFVMRGSVYGTVFQKHADDECYHHRNEDLNDWYQRLLLFEDGDEVLQIGCYSIATVTRYLMPWSRPRIVVPTPPAPAVRRGHPPRGHYAGAERFA
ncbi:MAG: hypothetical protein AAGI01_08750 [Myxococcota bacterium]